MPTLHDDIILAIAGFSKLKTITAMMRTNKAVHELIVRHERSIVKNAVRSYTNGDSSLLPPRGAVCSSHNVEREYLHSQTFDVLHELDIRKSRTETLLSEGQPLRNKINSAFSTTGNFLDLPQAERDILMARIKESFKVVDRLADCAADVMSEWMEPVGKTTAQKLDGDESVLETHSRQLDYIRSLSPLDLAYLYQLITWAGQAYAAQNPGLMSDADCWERLLAFKEATLRYGTIMLWAVFEPPKVTSNTNANPARRKPATELARFAEHNIRLILEEIRIYQSTETGQNRLPPGLHMTMSKTFVEKTGRPSTRQAFEMEHMILNDIFVE